MSPSPRVASRFFAAFYQWNCHSQQLAACSRVSFQCNSLRYIPTRYSSRCYHGSRLLLQQTQVQVQREDEESTLEVQNDASGSMGTHISKGVIQDLSAGEPGINVTDALQSGVDDPESLKSSVRKLMRQVPSSVAVVTAFRTEPGETAPQPLGVVVSSLCSVSLDPPTISFNIKRPSKTLESIHDAKGLFRVHFLTSNERSSIIADHFTRGNHAEAYASRRRELSIYLPRNLADPNASPSLAPQIWDDAVVSTMECKVTQEISVADHVIVVAIVNTIKSKATISSTLSYCDGRYISGDATPLLRHSLSEESRQPTEALPVSSKR